MENESLFKSFEDSKTPADVAASIGAIDTIITKKFTKTVFRDLLAGMKILLKFIQKSDLEAFHIILQWLKLYLRVENALDPSDAKERDQFEKYIPATISYIVAALQYKPTDAPQYHLQLLDLSLKLLEKVSEKTLKKVANLESGLIACLWLPIDFVGDFNTQMAALRLMVQLLKCIDDNKQDMELDKICRPQQRVLRDSIYSAVQVANFHAGKFEKAARDLLNNYNMNLAPNVLVYSMRCKTIKFGENGAFYKPLNADYLWIDLNYCPRTLTFNGRYRASNIYPYVNVGVTLQIKKLTLLKKILHVVLNGPPQFSKSITNENKLKTLQSLQFELYTDEVLRLKENHLVIDYYNTSENKENNLDSSNIETPSTISDATSEESFRCASSKDVEAAAKIIPEVLEVTTKQNALVEMPSTTAAEPKKPINLALENFEKSYSFLIGNSEKILNRSSSVTNRNIQNEKVPTVAKSINIQELNNKIKDISEPTIINSTKTNTNNKDSKESTLLQSADLSKGFKVPSLTFYENARLRASLSQRCNKIASQASEARKTIDNTQLTSLTIEDTPKTSLTGDQLVRNILQSSKQSVVNGNQLNGRIGVDIKRRFFSGHNQPCVDDTNTGAKKARTIKCSAKKRLKKYEKVFTSPPKRKQINKVKPMNHLAKSDGDPEEAVQEYVENGGIVNITNFLRNGNESAAVFNEEERRIILQNVQRINDDLERTAKKFFQKTDKDPEASAGTQANIDDIYDQRNVSEAEPGQSYRNFRVRRPKIEESCEEKSEPKSNKRRKNATKPKKAIAKKQIFEAPGENQENIENSSKPIPKTKRRAPKRKATSIISIPTTTTAELMKTVTDRPHYSDKAHNKTIYSQDMQMDLTCLDHDSAKITRNPDCANSQAQLRQSSKSYSKIEQSPKKIRTSKDVKEQEKSSVFNYLATTAVDDNNNTANKNVTNLSPMTITDSSFNLNDIQAVRQNTTIGELIADEKIWCTPPIHRYNGIHSPNLSDAMNVSDLVDVTPKRVKDKHTKNYASCNKSLFTKKSHINKSTNQDEILTRDSLEKPMEQFILYHERSDDEYSESGDDFSNLENTSSALLEEIHMTPNKVSLERSFATKSITRSSHKNISGAQPKLQTCKVRTTSITTRQIFSQDLFFGPTTSAENSSSKLVAQREKSAEHLEKSSANMMLSKLPTINDLSHCLVPYNNMCQKLEDLRNPFFKESVTMFETFKENMEKENQSFHSSLKLDAFYERVQEVSRNLLAEAEHERLDVEQTIKEITKIMHQLNWQWQSYQKKTERFNCFKQNTEQYLKALSQIDFESDINKEYEEFLAALRDKGDKLSSKLWQEFIQNTTDNLINNLSILTTL